MKVDTPLSSDNYKWPAIWIVFATLALASLAAWQREPSRTALILSGGGLLGAALSVSVLRRPRGWGLAALASIAVALAFAARETRNLERIARHWELWSVGEQQDRAARVAASAEEVARTLMAAARRAANDSSLIASASRSPRAQTLTRPLPGSVESALLVFRDGTLIAHAGQSRVPITIGDTGVRLFRTAFHTALIARSNSADGRSQGIAVALLASAPPADRFARSLAQVWETEAPRITFESADSAYARAGSSMQFVRSGTGNGLLMAVRALPFTEGETRLGRLQHARARTGVPMVIAAIFVLVVSWRRPARMWHRLASMAAILFVVSVAPLNALSNVSPLFDAASYFAPMGGALTANVAALIITTTLCLGALLLRLRTASIATTRRPALLLVLLIAGIGPFILRDLARGVALPPSGIGAGLWIAWQLAIALAGVSILLAGAAAGQVALGTRRGFHPAVAPVIAAVAALLAPSLWMAPGRWPAWYPILWIASIAAVALTRRKAYALVVVATFVAGAGAVTLVWGATIRERMELVAHDLERISAVDENASHLLERFALSMTGDSVHVSEPDALLKRYASSELALAGYPAYIAQWRPGSTVPSIEIPLAPVSDTIGAQAAIAQIARLSGSPEIQAVEDGPVTNLIAAIPTSDGIVTTVAVPPRTRLLPADPFALLTGVAGTRGGGAPYSLVLGGRPDSATSAPLTWRRIGNAMHGDGVAGQGPRARLVHIEVELPDIDVLVPRGTLLVLLDVGIVLLIWAATATAEGALVRWVRVRRARLARSYQVRLSATLIAFFIAPAAIFAGWSYYRLREDDRAARELLVREALRVAPVNTNQPVLAEIAREVGAPFFLYRDAQLIEASDPVLEAIAPIGRLLPESIDASDEEFGDEGTFASRRVAVRERDALIGYRRLMRADKPLVLATPARGNEFALDTRREDLGMLVLFATAIGVLAALWSSGIAARALSRPVGALREAALALASGRQEPMLGTAPASEFAPVYRAFVRMAEDLSVSRAELEAARRRTEAVLQHVASGVVAFDDAGDVIIANPRAEQLLGPTMRGASRMNALDRWQQELAPLAERLREFLAGDAEDDAFELNAKNRQLRARLTRLSGGAVLTIDDVTELASAQRVLAWGEMARQIAHEIKNPLTPIRLGVQHLRRAFRDGRGDFGKILESNVGHVLSEIDRLDEIARAFSRYGTAPADRAQPVPVDVVSTVRDVIALEQMGEDGVRWSLEVDGTPAELVALAIGDELKEVVLNLLENARLASAHHVRIGIDRRGTDVQVEVRDDGSGIAPDVLPRIFEPHFSTRTSGSGLGLAISRRLIEGWGGTIEVSSNAGGGTVVCITLRAAGAIPD